MLTPKQENFCLAYLETGNASEAYRRSYNTAKMKPETICRNAKGMLDGTKIAARIAELRKPVEEAVQIDLMRVVKELVRLATFDPRRLLNADGSPKPINELDDDTAAAIAGLDMLEQFEGQGKDRVFVGYVKKYKIADKNAALDKLMKHLGGYEKDNRQKADGVLDLIRAVAGANADSPAFPVVQDVSGGERAPD